MQPEQHIREAAPEPKKSRYRFVDLAKAFGKHYDRRLVFWQDQYWAYDGYRYEAVGDHDTMKLRIDKWHQDHASGLDITSHTTSEIEARLRASRFLENSQAMNAPLGSNETSRFVTTLRNGMLDLEPCLTGNDPVLRPLSSDWFGAACLPYSYNPRAKCPRWMSFLEQVFESDQQRIDLLQEWFGYCCTYDTSLEKAMFWEGMGGNGKSQAIEVLSALVGKHNTSAVRLDQIGERFQAVAMMGKLVNFCAEVDAGARVPISTLRHLITGDDFQFEKKGVDTFTAKPTARFVISMNQKPTFYDPSNALWRRIILVPWNFSVPEADRIPDLGRKIAAEELPGIFNWAIDGLIRLWQRGTFTESELVTEATRNLRLEGDPILKYLTDIYEKGSDENALVKTDAWLDVLKARDLGEVSLPAKYAPADFYRDVERVFGVQTSFKKINGKSMRVWNTLRKKTIS